MSYLVDSAGARITDQVGMFPGRRGAGRIFRTQIQASGSIPQVCALFALLGVRLHCSVSGSGHLLASSETEALEALRRYLSYLPQNGEQPRPVAPGRPPEPADLRALVPASERQAFDMPASSAAWSTRTRSSRFTACGHGRSSPDSPGWTAGSSA
jgi:methylmalonyl-CoA decarboxylase subunit alpha